MPNTYASLNVPVGTGVGTPLYVNDRTTKTICVSGAFGGLVVIEGTSDEVTWIPLLTFKRPDFKTFATQISALRVRRKDLVSGLPVVTLGSDAIQTQAAALAPPAGLNGAGAGENVTDQTIQTVIVEGAFQNPGMVIHIEGSQDGTSWVAACPAFTAPGLKNVDNLSFFLVRQRVSGRSVAGTDPEVNVLGIEVPICTENLPLPVLNGPGTGVDVSECSADKTVTVSAPGGDVPCRILVEGSNDAGVSWVPVQGWNTTGLRKLFAIFQQMRVSVVGLVAAIPGMTVNIGAPRAVCDPVEIGENTTDVSVGGA